jgi:hypothetical protein
LWALQILVEAVEQCPGEPFHGNLQGDGADLRAADRFQQFYFLGPEFVLVAVVALFLRAGEVQAVAFFEKMFELGVVVAEQAISRLPE